MTSVAGHDDGRPVFHDLAVVTISPVLARPSNRSMRDLHRGPRHRRGPRGSPDSERHAARRQHERTAGRNHAAATWAHPSQENDMTISLAIQGGFTRGQKKTGAPQLRFFLRVEHQKKRYAVSLRRIRSE